MQTNPKLEAIKSQLSSNIDSFRLKRAKNKRKAFLLHLSATSISALVTILLGLQGISQESMMNGVKNLALILSSIVTVLTGFDSFFNHRALWIRYTETLSQLLRLQDKLDYLIAGKNEQVSENELNNLFNEMQLILKETNAWWQDQRADGILERKSSVG